MSEHYCIQDGRLNRIENSIEKVEGKVDKLFKEDNEQKVFMTKLDMSLQQVIKSNENIESYIKESQVTFQKINENLDRLNRKSDLTDKKLEQMDGKFEEVCDKVDKLSDDFDKAESKNKIVVDQRDWLNKIFRKVILPVGGIVGGIFSIYEILNLLGLFVK